MKKESLKIVFFGPPASGKGTQAELLAKKFRLPLISTGNIFRWHIKKKTFLGKKLEKLINQGKFVPDRIVNKIVASELKKIKKGFILDGFPRNLSQAKELAKISPPDLVIEIMVSSSEVIRRISGRRVCECGETYHLIYNPPKREGICDSCGKKLFQREDDKKKNVLKRLKIYYSETKPLEDFYQKQNKLIKINGEQSIDKVHQEILKKIKSYFKKPKS